MEMEDMDYAIMFVEEKYGNGVVFEMVDYIEDKRKEEEV